MSPSQTQTSVWSFLNLQNFHVSPPIQTNAVTNFDPSTISKDASNTRIVVHSRFPSLVQRFLNHKLLHGSGYEKALYADLTWEQEVARLIEKRPLVFMGASEHTMLRNGKNIPAPAMQWDRNGTHDQGQNSDLTLADYLSYDEVMLSSLIGVSGPSYFINDGNRYNGGNSDATGSFEPRGIICGLVGARFEREDRMDSIFILPPVARPKQHLELTALFWDFFGSSRTSPQQLFNEECYKARIGITADILLLEAGARAAAATDQCVTPTAYVYVVGLGLGVWQYQANQAEIYLAAFADSITSLPQNHRISTIEFAYIKASPQAQRLVTEAAQKKGIEVIFSRRNPAAKLDTKHENQLLVLSYAWDGNAFPGNEYWQGSLMGSGDPAAACMSTIGELHNPLVNPAFTKRIAVVSKED